MVWALETLKVSYSALGAGEGEVMETCTSPGEIPSQQNGKRGQLKVLFPNYGLFSPCWEFPFLSGMLVDVPEPTSLTARGH